MVNAHLRRRAAGRPLLEFLKEQRMLGALIGTVDEDAESPHVGEYIPLGAVSPYTWSTFIEVAPGRGKWDFSTLPLSTYTLVPIPDGAKLFGTPESIKKVLALAALQAIQGVMGGQSTASPAQSPFVSSGEWLPYTASSGGTLKNAKLKPSLTYVCRACKTSLDERDAAVNPKTGKIWGCYKCGGKDLEQIGDSKEDIGELAQKALEEAAKQMSAKLNDSWLSGQWGNTTNKLTPFISYDWGQSVSFSVWWVEW
jgi:ribosomal protein L37AE/L43A